MPLHVEWAANGDPGSPTIIVRSIGPDGLEINRDRLSLAETVGHLRALRAAARAARAHAREAEGRKTAPAVPPLPELLEAASVLAPVAT